MEEGGIGNIPACGGGTPRRRGTREREPDGEGQQKSPPPWTKGGEPMEALIAVAQGVIAGLITELLIALARAARKAIAKRRKRKREQ